MFCYFVNKTVASSISKLFRTKLRVRKDSILLGTAFFETLDKALNKQMSPQLFNNIKFPFLKTGAIFAVSNLELNLPVAKD